MTADRLAQLQAFDASLGEWSAPLTPGNADQLLVVPGGSVLMMSYPDTAQPLARTIAPDIVELRAALTEALAAITPQ